LVHAHLRPAPSPTRRSSDLAGHTILKLALADQPDASPDAQAFSRAVLRAMENPEQVTARLFSIRSGPLLGLAEAAEGVAKLSGEDRKSTRLNSSHVKISYAV